MADAWSKMPTTEPKEEPEAMASVDDVVVHSSVAHGTPEPFPRHSYLR